MGNRARSLHMLVEKWCGSGAAGHARVRHFCHSREKLLRYVCVEISRPSGAVAIIFFRHADGSWCVFPPDRKRPAMGVRLARDAPAADIHHNTREARIA